MGCSMALEEGRKGSFGGIRRMWNATRASWMWHANKVSLNRRTECKYLTLVLVKQCTSCSPLCPALSLSLTQLQVEWPFVSSWVTLHTVKRLHSYWFDVALYFCVFSFCLNSILVHCTFCDGRKCDQADDWRWKWLAGGRGAWLTRIVYGGRDKQTVCQQLQSAKNAVVVGQIASWQLGDSPLSSLCSLPPSPSPLPRCQLFWYIFEFGNLVICNLLSFFRNLSGRCMLNATREIT